MSYQEKRTIVSVITGALVLAAYCIYAFGQPHPGDLKFWASTMLVFIGIGIVASIVIQIVFHILLSVSVAVKEKVRDVNTDDKVIEKTIGAEMVEDEMDKLINMKSTRISFIFAGIGFVAALLSLVLDYPPVVMLNLLFISMSVGSMFEGFTQLYFYRRGVKNG